MNDIAVEKEWYLENFARFEKKLNGQSGTDIHKIREKAIDQFSKVGFPNNREEAWRFTNLSHMKSIQFDPILDKETTLPDRKVVEESVLPGLNHSLLVFVNGQFVKDLSSTLSLPENVQVMSFAEALEKDSELVSKHVAQYANYKDNAFTALNTAFMSDGAYVYVPKGVVLEKPVQVLFLSKVEERTFVAHPRNLFVIDDNAQATIIESYVGMGDNLYFTNPVTEIVVGENSVLDHYKIERESEQAFHIAIQQSYHKRHSNFVSHNFTFGGSLVRNDINANLDGEGVDATLDGLYLLWKDQHVDNHTLIEHAQPHGNSRELYKGILYDESRAVFNGKIHVHQKAQKTDAVQNNKNIVVSESATVDTQPQLEIFADDVKCTHGGTVGQLDEDGVFYLRSRGVQESKARQIMIHAFAGEVTDQIKIESLKEQIDRWVVERLYKRS